MRIWKFWPPRRVLDQFDVAHRYLCPAQRFWLKQINSGDSWSHIQASSPCTRLTKYHQLNWYSVAQLSAASDSDTLCERNIIARHSVSRRRCRLLLPKALRLLNSIRQLFTKLFVAAIWRQVKTVETRVTTWQPCFLANFLNTKPLWTIAPCETSQITTTNLPIFVIQNCYCSEITSHTGPIPQKA